VLFGDLKSSTEVVCQLLEETIQTVAKIKIWDVVTKKNRRGQSLKEDKFSIWPKIAI